MRYTYDDQNQLKTETRYTYSSNTDTTGTAVTTTYTYDTAGNIRSASDGTSTLSYEYNNNDWKDLLTKVGGTTISYDGSGNPANWYNGAKSYSGLTWQNGRQLARITVGGKTSKYTYDADGIRSTKDVNGTKHEYRTLNGKVVWEKIGEGTSAKIMVFSYDAQGRPFGFKFSKDNGTKFTNYFYALNQQGDVVKIFRPVAVKDADGNVTGYTEKTYATYTYDAWGKLIGITNSAGTSIINKQTTSTSLANLNPLRYRGYYYDNETGFYYLQSRYYDPAVKRFINADIYASTDSSDAIACNMFAYCGNNPAANTDASGSWYIKAFVKWFAEEIAKPVVQYVQEKVETIDFSASRGISLTGTPGAFSFNFQVGTAFDAKGNVALQASFSGGVTGGTPGGSAMFYRTLTNSPSIAKLEGESYQIGGSLGVPVYGVPIAAGVDFNILPDSELEKTHYYGLTTSLGVGTPGAEFHTTWGQTSTIKGTQFNVFRIAKAIYEKIMEW